MSVLIVIDDTALRRPFFLKAAKIVAKSHRLAKTCSAFQEDQNLFQSWYQLTFKGRIATIEGQRAEWEQLLKILRDVEDLQELLKIAAPAAYRILKDEERNFQDGDADIRARIESSRQARADKLRAMRAREEADYWGDEEDGEKTSSESDSGEKDPLRSRERTFYDAVNAASQSDIRDISRSYEAISFLTEVFNTCTKLRDYGLFLRVWSMTSKKNQKEFIRVFEEDTGDSFAAVFRMLEEAHQKKEKGEGTKPDVTANAQAERTELVKLLYRKLARLLHPDLQGAELSGDHQYWLERNWNRLQTSYRRQDLRDLQRLEVIVLLRNQALDQLTIAELSDGLGYLNEDFLQLRRESEDLRKHPAWNFSRKKNHKALEAKLSKQLNEEARELKESLREMRAEEALLDLLSQEQPKRKLKSKKVRGRNR